MTSIGTFAPGSGGILDVTIPPPPVGTDWDYTLPARTRLRLICGRCGLTTSAVVANRRPQLWIASLGNVIAQSANYGLVQASTLQPFTLTPGNDIVTAIAGFDIWLVFPPGLILLATDQIGVTTALLQGADQWGDTYLRFEEWIEA